MDYLIISIVVGIILIFLYLYHRHRWKVKHIISILLALSSVTIFAIYGQNLITPIWKNVNASSLWLVVFLGMYVGSAILASIPFFLDGKKINENDFKILFKFLKVGIIAGMIYFATDNVLFGPYAVGPNSPYLGQSLCHLNPTYLAEDVFAGCQLEKLGINPFTDLASVLIYFWLDVLIGFVIVLMVGAKKLEKIIFSESLAEYKAKKTDKKKRR